MNKRQLITEIRVHNTSADAKFLAQFDEKALAQYLDHLQNAPRRNIRLGSTVRRLPTPIRAAS